MGYTEIGDEVVGGDDVEAMLGEAYEQERWSAGATPGYSGNPPRGMQRYRPQPYPQRVGRGQTLLKEKQWTKSRQYVIGFDSVTTIAAAASSNLTIQPQVLFRPERLVVSSAIAPSFLITDFKVGKNSQFVAAGNVPADIFAPSSFGVRLKCDTAQVSAILTLGVSNISNSALRFVAGLFGEAVE